MSQLLRRTRNGRAGFKVIWSLLSKEQATEEAFEGYLSRTET